MKKKILPVNVVILLVLALIWGSSYILMKKGLVSFSAVQVSMLRILFAAIALTPFLPAAFRNFNKRDLFFAAIVAILGSGIPSYLYPLAITHVDSGVTGIINTLTPVFTLLFGWFFFKTQAGAAKVLGLVIALAGAVILILFQPAQSGASFEPNGYALAAVLATVCYGFSSNVLKSKLNHINALELTSLTFALIAPIAAFILFSTNFTDVLHEDKLALPSIGFIAILGVIGTAFALVLFNFLIKRTDALYASSVTFLMPIVAISWGILDGEKITFLHMMGLFCIFVGLYFMNKRTNK